MTNRENLPQVPPQNGQHGMVDASATEHWHTPEPPPTPGVKRALQSVWTFKWYVLPIVIVGTALGVMGARYMPASYRAQATLWVEVREQGSQQRGPLQSPGLLRDLGWLELMRSWRVLDAVVNEQRLYLEHDARDRALMAGFALDSVFRPGRYRLVLSETGHSYELRTQDDAIIERGELGGAVGARTGFLWQPDPSLLRGRREVVFTVRTPREAARRLNDRLGTRMGSGQGQNFINIDYSAGDPEHAAAVINTVATTFVDVAADLKRLHLRELRDILETQLERSAQNLQEADFALERFRVQTITLPGDAPTPASPGLEATRAPVMTQFFELKAQRDGILRDREAVERSLRLRTADGGSLDALSAVPAAQQSPELVQATQELAVKRAALRTLQQQYTDDHPLVRRARQDIDDLEQRTIPQLTSNLLVELDHRLSAMDRTIASVSTELQEIPPRVIEEARFRRNHQTAENLYNELRLRYETARMATETSVPDVRVLDLATVPSMPEGDDRMRLMMLAFLGSLGMGAALAIVLGRMDARIRYPEQVTHGLKLDVLGAVPTLQMKGIRGGADNAEVVESLRALRLNLMNAYGSAGPIMATVSSPGPNDGKTFITANLALSFADLGMRTLVVDGDVRRGNIHHIYEVDRRPGLTDMLGGEASLSEVIRRTAYPLIQVIPSGTRMHHAPELLSSPAMGEMLAGIRANYDVILFDSPPLGAGVDPLVLASLSANLVLVMRTKVTDVEVAEAKLQMLDRLPVRVLGVVLNGVDRGGFRYYSYLPGYETGDETVLTKGRLVPQKS
jgi:polysaccharide biosynthesis transport protein